MAEQHVAEIEAIQGLLGALQELPHVEAHAEPVRWERQSGLARADAAIDFRIDGKEYMLLVEIKKSLYPRDARQAVWAIKDYMAHLRGLKDNRPIIPLLAADSISKGAKELLKTENVGYYDSSGSLFIPAQGAFFYIDKPQARAVTKSVRTLFRGKRSQVIHALLSQHEKWLGVKEIAKLAEVSPATASETLAAMERFDWLASRGQGPSKERHLIQPAMVLDEWKNHVLAAPASPVHRYYVSNTKLDELEARIDKIWRQRGFEYVLTQEAAAQRYAPYLSSMSRVAYRMSPGRRTTEALRDLGANAVSEGANLLVIDTPSRNPFLFKQEIDSTWLASPIQVYLDLFRASGRARDMAEHLRRERIGF